MSSNLQVAADFTLVRGRFPRRLWGNVGPRRNSCLTCSQWTHERDFCCKQCVAFNEIWEHKFSPTLRYCGGVRRGISGYLLTFRPWWDFSPARLLNRNSWEAFAEKHIVWNVIFWTHRPGECRWLLRRAWGQGSRPPVLDMTRGWFVTSQLWKIIHPHLKWDEVWLYWFWPSCRVWGRSCT